MQSLPLMWTSMGPGWVPVQQRQQLDARRHMPTAGSQVQSFGLPNSPAEAHFQQVFW